MLTSGSRRLERAEMLKMAMWHIGVSSDCRHTLVIGNVPEESRSITDLLRRIDR